MMLLAQVLLAGSAACAPCHTAIVRTYNATPMAQSSGRVSGDVHPGSLRHAASGITYRIDADGTVALEKTGGREVRRFDYFIGSGAAGRSFLYSRDGFLFQAPVTWYAQSQRWDVSPGYENDRVSRWSRPIEPSCLYCHASEPSHVEGTQNRYRAPPFAQNGVACERCHGPGAEHARGRGGMIHPAKLAPAQRDAICAQCHLSGEARIEKAGRKLSGFRPGQALSGYVAYFTYDDRRSALKATSHFEKMYASRCKISSGDRLWCGSCHDPHTVPAGDQRVAWYRARCLGCHQPETCKRGDDCVSCHMPKGRVVDGGHGVLTDHSIPRRAARIAFEQPTPWRLAGFSRADAGDRELGLAYAEVFLRTGDRRQRDEALRLLESAPPGPAVELRLGDLYQRTGQIARAETLYRSVLKQDANNVVALVNLAGVVASRGRLDDAILMW
ncbi:MAG: cytochrome c3 family protein, partial [Bryobacteraceae bacterium]